MQLHKIKVSTTMNVLEDNLKYLKDFKQFNKQLKEDTLSVGDQQHKTTNVKAYMTHWQMADKFDSYARLLKLISIEKIPKYDDSYPIQEGRSGRKNIYCNDMWGVVYNKGEETLKHSHMNMFSFTYYIEAPKNCAPLIFSSPGKLTIQPKTGDLFIWRGDYEHYVPKQKINKPRIIIAGNLDYQNKPIAKII